MNRLDEENQESLSTDWVEEMPELPTIVLPQEDDRMVQCKKRGCELWVARDDAIECLICHSFYCKKHRLTECPVCLAKERK